MARRNPRTPQTLSAILSLLLLGAAHSATYHIDPHNGSSGGDGSPGNPWRTLQGVADNELDRSVSDGDTLLLKSGYHGDVHIADAHNAEPVTIVAEERHGAHLKHLELESITNWTIVGLSISPEHASHYERTRRIVNMSSCRNVVIEECRIFSVQDVSSWSMNDWNDLACDGILLDGRNHTIRNNYIKNVAFGIRGGAESSLVEYNTIENFAGDGMRGLADNMVFQYNTVKNCYDVNGNHDDGFQSWSRPDGGSVGSGTRRGIVLRGNTIINYEDPDQRFRGTLQGIGCFDGMFEDWVIENNLIVVDQWHGITLRGAKNCRIVNNTIVDPNATRPGPPWIRLDKHKNGTPSSGCVVRNNLAADYSMRGPEDLTMDHNLEYNHPEELFRDYQGGDFRLRPECQAVDAGSSELAPERDIAGVSRPQGAAFDLGAYEFFLAPTSTDHRTTRRLPAANPPTSNQSRGAYGLDGRLRRTRTDRPSPTGAAPTVAPDRKGDMRIQMPNAQE